MEEIVGTKSEMKDILKLKQINEKLERGDKYFRSLVSSIGDLIFVLDNNLVFLEYFDPESDSLYTESKDFLGKSIKDVFPKTFSDIVLPVLKEVIKTGKEQSIEYSLPKKNKLYYYNTKISRIHDSKNLAIGLIVVVRDITERKKAEEALQESEEKCRQVISTTKDAIMVFNGKTKKFIEVNKACEDLYGYSREEFLKLKVKDITAEPESSGHYIRKALKGELKKMPLRYHEKKGGTIFPVEISVSNFNWGGHNMLYWFVRDITERKNMEDRLRKSEEKYRKIFDLSPEGIALLDRKGNIIDGNERLYDWVGYKPKEVIGKNLAEMPFFSKESKLKIMKNFSRRISGKEVSPYEIYYISKSGEKRFARIVASVIKDKKGEITEVIVMISDITESKKVEEKIRYQAALLENVNDSISSVDINGNITFWNKTAEETFGWKEEEVLGKPISSITTPPEYEGRSQKIMKQVMKEGRWKGNLVYIKKDKTLFKTLTSISLMKNKQNEPSGAVGIMTDLTELEKLKKEKKVLSEKVTKLTKKIPLTENEKLVFYGLVKYPLLNDKQLSDKLNIKRSTITAIKNKLLRLDFYSPYFIPNFEQIGCDLLCILNGKIPVDETEEKNNIKIFQKTMSSPEFVYNINTDKEFLSIIISKNFIETKKLVDFLSSAYEGEDIERLNLLYFPFTISKIINLFDYSNLLRSLFSLNLKEEPEKLIKLNQRDLTKNEKIILYALTKYPRSTDLDIAVKTKISRSTVSLIKKNLIMENFLKMINFPNIKKLNCELFFYSNTKIDIKNNKLNRELSSLIFRIDSERESGSIFIFENYTKYKETYDKLINTLKKNEEPKKYLFPIKEIIYEKIDFASLVKKILELEIDF